MKLIVISTEAENPHEHSMLAKLFATGLTSYHLRKPTWTRAQLTAWLHALPPKFHPRIVLHTHHDLATEFAVGGLHDRDHTPDQSNPIGYFGPGVLRSRAVHDLPTLRASLGTYDRLLVSPIFPSFSKPGRTPPPDVSHAELRTIFSLPHHSEVIALGGIDASRIADCRDLGFDGVAVLGAIWQSANPVRVFTALQSALASSPISSRPSPVTTHAA